MWVSHLMPWPGMEWQSDYSSEAGEGGGATQPPQPRRTPVPHLPNARPLLGGGQRLPSRCPLRPRSAGSPPLCRDGTGTPLLSRGRTSAGRDTQVEGRRGKLSCRCYSTYHRQAAAIHQSCQCSHTSGPLRRRGHEGSQAAHLLSVLPHHIHRQELLAHELLHQSKKRKGRGEQPVKCNGSFLPMNSCTSPGSAKAGGSNPGSAMEEGQAGLLPFHEQPA